MNYTAFVWNGALNRYIIAGGEAENPEALKEQLTARLQPFCEVRKVVTNETYQKALAKAKRENKRAGLAEAYHYC